MASEKSEEKPLVVFCDILIFTAFLVLLNQMLISSQVPCAAGMFLI